MEIGKIAFIKESEMYLKYLKHVLVHKLNVYRAGKRIAMSKWALILHDWSKFLPSEFVPYAKFFYGDQASQNEFNKAWLHHIHFSPHHWQHWILREDEGSTIVLEMPLKYRKEMIADWASFGNIYDWYEENKHKIELAQETKLWVESYIKMNYQGD